MRYLLLDNKLFLLVDVYVDDVKVTTAAAAAADVAIAAMDIPYTL